MAAIAIAGKFDDATSVNGRHRSPFNVVHTIAGPKTNTPHALNDLSPLIDAGSCF
jgi:hypothetical protein